MADKAFVALLAKVRRLEEDYEEMSAKVDLLIHSVNNLYDEVYRDGDYDSYKDTLEGESVKNEPAVTEGEKEEGKIESVADVILAIAEELERRKKL